MNSYSENYILYEIAFKYHEILQYLELEAINLISVLSMKYKWSYYIAKKIIENDG